jgi:hypothetical protein
MGVVDIYPHTRPIFWKLKLYVDNHGNNCHLLDSEFLKREDYICLILYDNMPWKHNMTLGAFVGVPRCRISFLPVGRKKEEVEF